MAISVGNIGSTYGMSYVRPLNLAVKNEGEISDAFIETGMSGAVMNVPPVVYPNAGEVSPGDSESDPLKLGANVVKRSQEAGRMYNDIAATFKGMTTGYGQTAAATSYGMEGNTIDLFG